MVATGSERMKRIALLAAAAAFVWASNASALTKTERNVLGWTSDNDVVIGVVARGETIVDGVPQEFYVEATEVWHADPSRPPSRYDHGTATGNPPDPWSALGAATDGAQLRANVVAGHDSTRNPAGTNRFAWATAEAEKRPDELNFVCEARTMVVMGATSAKKFYDVLQKTTTGELSRRRDEALCPRAKVITSWSPDGKHGFVLVQLGAEVGATVVPAEVGPGHPAQHHFAPTKPLISQLSEGRAAQAWDLAATGDYDRARGYFESAEDPAGAALSRALAKDRKATRAADAAFKKSKKEPGDIIMRAAAHVAAGRGKSATSWIDDAVAKTNDYPTLLRHAAVFAIVDSAIANQLVVHALSRPVAEGEDATRARAWVLLASGLLQLGEFSKALESLEKIKQHTPSSRAALAQVYLDKRRKSEAADQIEMLLFANPGDCRAWLLAGRHAALQGDNKAAGAAFDAAAGCDPALAEAIFYTADFARIAGDVAVAREHFERYLAVAPARADHMIRQLRRDAAKQWTKRLGHEGVILTDLSCRRGAPETFLCTGTLRNTSKEAAEGVKAEAREKSRTVGTAEIPAIGPGAAAPFGLSFKAKALKDVVIRAGKDEKERKLNQTPAR